MKAKIYYDYHNDSLVPIWFVICFHKGELNWEKNTLYVPTDTPFERIGVEEFLPDTFGISVILADLTVRADKPGMFGVYLPFLRQRSVEQGYDYWDAEQLIIQVSDIEEVLQMRVFM